MSLLEQYHAKVAHLEKINGDLNADLDRLSVALRLARHHLFKHDETCHAIGEIEAALREVVDA